MDYRRTEVQFKVEDGEILAVFPELKGWRGEVTCYAKIEQHVTACPDYIATLDDATAAESEALRAELVAIGYRLKEAKQ